MKKCLGCMRDYPDSATSCPHCGWSDQDSLLLVQEFREILAPGSILNERFIIGRLLSRNRRFSYLYLAWDALLSRRVVIREFLPEEMASRAPSGRVECMFEDIAGFYEECLCAMEDEAALLGQNQGIFEVLNYYRTFRENGTVYVVTEYLEGCTLEDLLMAEGAMDASQKLLLVQSIADTLLRLHEKGICHHNLSPDNIYIGSDYGIKLIDFGAAKLFWARKLGQTDGILDRRYCAPELLRADAEALPADLYSLGAVYYRMVSGVMPPLKKRTYLQVKDGTAEDIVALLTARNPGDRIEGLQKLRKVKLA